MCMNTQHTKSSCCNAKVNRFGQRRRLCIACRRTWRIRQKKRGRKALRAGEDLVLRFFQKRLPPLRVVAKARGCGKDTVQLRVKKSLAVYLKKHGNDWLALLVSPSPLIAVADAIWYRVQGQRYTIYVILLRPIKSDQAVICPPVIVKGHESIPGWREALEALPKSLEKRIVALVSDGVGSLLSLVKARPWVIQRCHFHLISAVQNYLTTGPRSRNRQYAFRVMHLVQEILTCADQGKLQTLTRALAKIRTESRSRGLRRVLGGLLRDLADYHAYLNFPELHLPATSNTAESFIQCLRDLMYRCRGFRSLESLQTWLKGLAAFKSTMQCNGKKSTKLNR